MIRGSRSFRVGVGVAAAGVLAAGVVGPGQAAVGAEPVAAQTAQSLQDCHSSSLLTTPVRWYNDGSKGMIKNFSEHPIYTRLTGKGVHYEWCRVRPGHGVAYAESGRTWLELTSDPTGPVPKSLLRLDDPTIGYPDVGFRYDGNQSGGTDDVQKNSWRENEAHHIKWGDAHLWLKREKDGWQVPNKEWRVRADGYDVDWAVFSIHVDKLPRTATCPGAATHSGDADVPCVRRVQVRQSAGTARITWRQVAGLTYESRIRKQSGPRGQWRPTSNAQLRVPVPRHRDLTVRLRAVDLDCGCNGPTSVLTVPARR